MLQGNRDLLLKKKKLQILKIYLWSKKLLTTTKRCHMLKNCRFKCKKKREKMKRPKIKSSKRICSENKKFKMKFKKRLKLTNLKRMKVRKIWLLVAKSSSVHSLKAQQLRRHTSTTRKERN
jgi:hypothetical protein